MLQYRPLGIFRFLLASMVVVSHTHILAGKNISDFLSPFGFGNMAVMSFFVLSGFVIAEAISVFYSKRILAFLINRLLRILPPFFAALILSIIIHFILVDYGVTRTVEYYGMDNSANFMFTFLNVFSNFFVLVFPYGMTHLGLDVNYIFVRYSWAIAVELLFYYSIAIYFSIANYRQRTSSFSDKLLTNKLFYVVVLFFLFYPVIITNTIFITNWIPYFLFGITLYYMVSKKIMPMFGWIVLFMSFIGINFHAYTYISKNPSSNVFAAILFLNVLIFTLIILSRFNVNGKFKIIDRWLGDLTYPLYLNHYIVSITLLTLVDEKYFGTFLFIGGYLICVLVSYCVMMITEPFTIKLRNKIRGASI